MSECLIESTPQPSWYKHPIVDDAPNGELGVFLDRIILEILIAPVAVDEQSPFRIALANAGEQREVHRGAFDVERLVVLDHAHGAQRIQRARIDVDGFAEHLEMGATQELVRLAHVLAFGIHRKRECLQPRGRLPFVEQQLVKTKEDRSAVDAARKWNADRRRRILHGEPAAQLAVNRFDVLPPREIEILRKRGAGRIEEAPVYGVRIGTTDQAQGGDVVRRNHSRIARVELTRPSTSRQLRRDRIDPLGNDQYRTIGSLCEKVAQRTVETARQDDALAILRDEGKGSFETEYCVDIAGEHATPGFGLVNGSESCWVVGNQVDDAGNGQRLAHSKKIPPVRSGCYRVFVRCNPWHCHA